MELGRKKEARLFGARYTPMVAHERVANRASLNERRVNAQETRLLAAEVWVARSGTWPLAKLGQVCGIAALQLHFPERQ